MIEPEIRDENYEAMRHSRVVAIEQVYYGWRVHTWAPDGSVGPHSDYDTPHEAAARAMQMLGIKEPVTPQNWPERIGIGEINGKPVE